ncbi:hypothetical protein LIG30_2753 [Burkholderia sp. lig30]|jgi:hypothetical protein|uniref:alginate O-acetyltransferase AlgX-related protein n=1 Tax=Burkholderia sp. lig30 TaxID=1192124 RepID=UPI000461BFBC|nr:hypothetical protein [Burkholderia sp. lig30]KDB08078.1 hypothetical protein LIG30_2753 [Burkholderia sp. lig30]
MFENVESSTAAAGERRWAAAVNRAIVAAVFFGLLALPVVWFGRASFAPAPLHENRVMTPFPDLSIHTLQQFERWFSDRYGMRDALVYYGSRLQMARTGTPTNQDVVVGPGRWLFFDPYHVPGQPHFADLLGKDPLSSSQLQDIGHNLRDIHKALAACKIPFYFVIAPDKQTVYPEKLGVHVPADARTETDQVVAFLRERDPDLRVIDLRGPVIDAKASAPYEIYKRTDTHWNSLGAFYGYRAIMGRLVRDGVLAGAPWADLDQWHVTQHPFDQGDIAVNLLSLPGYFEDFNTTFDKRTPRLARSVPAPADAQPDEGQFTENPQGKGGLLLYRDSFSGELMPFLSEDFAHMWSYLGRDVDGSEVRRRSPSVVVLEIVERNVRMLTKNPQRNLGDACSR